MRSELALFTGEQEFNEGLLRAGWYLHAIATTRNTVADDSSSRRGDAGRVSAHVFDVYLQQSGSGLDEATYRRYAVAAQVGYLIGDTVPNATAINARRTFEEPSLLDSPGLCTLHAAGLLFALDLRALGPFLSGRRAELQDLDRNGFTGAAESPFGAAAATIDGIGLLRDYFVDGNEEALSTAQQRFSQAINNRFSFEDTDSRWVAALMSDFGTAFGATSLWAILPPDHPEVHLAFTRGDPPIALLWPPQAEFLQLQPSPFDAESRRLVLSFPTSAGKTLLAQLLICHHVASETGEVCVVAPTHSLCREIKTALDERLQFLGTWAHDASTRSDAGEGVGARVTIMTPERLSAVLRVDPASALNRFTLFVIDEAHLLREPQRGWSLEEALTLLHYLTRDGAHRIIVMSAALGNAAHVTQWLTTDTAPISHSSNWRGPRRLQVVFSPKVADWNDFVEVPAKGKKQPRREYKQEGTFYLRPRGQAFMRGTFGTTGRLVRKWSPKSGAWIRDESTTSQIEQLLPMIRHLVDGAGQPCLVVVASRRDAKSLAALVAESMPVLPANAGLADLLRTRLPTSHALPDMIARGVAYHHAVLPREVQAELEDATRRLQVRCLVSTTTLTEGVNLPFKSVVIGKTGWGSGDSRTEIIDPSRLLNAFGRAGRACRETEGWLFFAWFDSDPVEQLDRFDATASNLELISSLLGEEALESLQTFEDLHAEGVDAVLADAGHAANGFCAYVWFVADLLAQLQSTSVLGDRVRDVLKSTLAWQQFTQGQRSRWESVSEISLARYEAWPVDQRRRWSRTGTSLSTASVLDDLSVRLRDRVIQSDAPVSASGWFQLLLAGDVLPTLITLPENRQFRGIRPRFNASLDKALKVDYLEMVQRWTSGQALDEIADEMLRGVPDEDYRADVLTEFVAAVFEHHLPWVLRTVIDWANSTLSDVHKIPVDLPLYIQHGVGTPTALELMTNGVRSRRLATRVANELGEDHPDVLRDRLRNMTVDLWREVFDAAPTELRDLLAYVHDPTLQPASRLLRGEPIELDFELFGQVVLDAPSVVELVRASHGPEPRTWVVELQSTPIGVVAASAHMSVDTLTGLGTPIRIVASRAAGPRLTITPAEA